VARTALTAASGRFQQGVREWGAFTARCSAALGGEHPDTALAQHVWGLLQAAAGGAGEALISQRRTRAGLIAGCANNTRAAERSAVYIRSLVSSAEALLTLGQTPRALRYLESAVELAGASLGGRTPSLPLPCPFLRCRGRRRPRKGSL
jgi:hypothetical protein